MMTWIAIALFFSFLLFIMIMIMYDPRPPRRPKHTRSRRRRARTAYRNVVKRFPRQHPDTNAALALTHR